MADPEITRVSPPLRILVDSMVDEHFTNAQMSNAREIIRRLDPKKFHISVFYEDRPDRRIRERPNTRLIRLPKRRQTVRILREFLFGGHKILFYMKSAPASRVYQRLRSKWKGGRITIGTVESQSDLHNEPTVKADSIRLWEQTVLKCDFLFSNSGAVQRSLQREYKLPSEIVETGIDTNFFVPAADRKTNLRPRVLFAGSLRPFKQPQFLVEAATRFPQADFFIAGEGILAEELRKKAENARVPNLTLLGPLTAEFLKREYQQADIFLFPSKWEGSPKVILEAAACGLPVIARKEYSPETVIDGETGYLVGSEAEMNSKLILLLNQPDLCRRLGNAGRLHSQKFDWDLITLKWEAVFLRLVSQTRESS